MSNIDGKMGLFQEEQCHNFTHILVPTSIYTQYTVHVVRVPVINACIAVKHLSYIKEQLHFILTYSVRA